MVRPSVLLIANKTKTGKGVSSESAKLLMEGLLQYMFWQWLVMCTYSKLSSTKFKKPKAKSQMPEIYSTRHGPIQPLYTYNLSIQKREPRRVVSSSHIVGLDGRGGKFIGFKIMIEYSAGVIKQ